MNDTKPTREPLLITLEDRSFAPLQRIFNAPRDHLTSPPPAAKAAATEAPKGPAPQMPAFSAVRDEARVGRVTLRSYVRGTVAYTVDGAPEVRLGVDSDGWMRGLIKTLRESGNV